ncbi:hypothetical protein ACU16_19310 [Xanthomonas oryzae pv. oryzicola]|nr:hypothetical protein BE73_02770 [Xanthomonas oryzae pv. oryzicola]AKO05928.1 hypothetical protein ACU16_19310 [Xanthomonas oryzae pv. oryzicola]
MLKPAKISPPSTERERSTASSRSSVSTEATNCGYAGCALTGWRGNPRHNNPAVSNNAPEAIQYTVCQPPTPASTPAAVRASRMPSNNPLITVPITRPRSSGAASVAANGTRICAATELAPVTIVPTSNIAKLCELALTSRPSALSTNKPRIRPRRSSRSPSGTGNSNPATYS